jgi:predicted MFS family arabinose efflux permease
MLTDVVGTRNAMMVLLCGSIVSFVLIPSATHDEIATFAVIAVWGYLPSPFHPCRPALWRSPSKASS